MHICAGIRLRLHESHCTSSSAVEQCYDPYQKGNTINVRERVVFGRPLFFAAYVHVMFYHKFSKAVTKAR